MWVQLFTKPCLNEENRGDQQQEDSFNETSSTQLEFLVVIPIMPCALVKQVTHQVTRAFYETVYPSQPILKLPECNSQAMHCEPKYLAMIES